MLPSLTRSSLDELAYWVDWANLLAIARRLRRAGRSPSPGRCWRCAAAWRPGPRGPRRRRDRPAAGHRQSCDEPTNR
ncbi:MAG: hypothetical protein MZW92_30160 [Comamonadaceae bacterium]|nr:hypothetical protein [Comamonadaceae bacterium]